MRGFGGIFGNPLAGSIAQQMGPRAPQAPMQDEKRWLDGGKFKTRDAIALALGAIGSGFGRSNTFGQFLTNDIAQRRALQQQEQLYNRQREDSFADYQRRKQFDLSITPPEMDEFDTAMTRAGILKGSPEYNQFAREYAERKARGADPFLQGAPLPGGGSFTGPYGAYQQMIGGGAAPADAPETLPADFFRGGAASNSGGNFRP